MVDSMIISPEQGSASTGTTATTQPENFSSSGNPRCKAKKQPVIPRDSDVILGRGRKMESRLGNQYLLKIIGDHVEPYRTTNSRSKKKYITVKIIETARSMGIRFIRQDHTEADDETIRIRVGQSLRYMMKRKATDPTAPRKISSECSSDESSDEAAAPAPPAPVVPATRGFQNASFPPMIMNQHFAPSRSNSSTTTASPPHRRKAMSLPMARFDGKSNKMARIENKNKNIAFPLNSSSTTTTTTQLDVVRTSERPHGGNSNNNNNNRGVVLATPTVKLNNLPNYFQRTSGFAAAAGAPALSHQNLQQLRQPQVTASSPASGHNKPYSNLTQSNYHQPNPNRTSTTTTKMTTTASTNKGQQHRQAPLVIDRPQSLGIHSVSTDTTTTTAAAAAAVKDQASPGLPSTKPAVAEGLQHSGSMPPVVLPASSEDDMLNLTIRDLAGMYQRDPILFSAVWSAALDKIISIGTVSLPPAPAPSSSSCNTAANSNSKPMVEVVPPPPPLQQADDSKMSAPPPWSSTLPASSSAHHSSREHDFAATLLALKDNSKK